MSTENNNSQQANNERPNTVTVRFLRHPEIELTFTNDGKWPEWAVNLGLISALTEKPISEEANNASPKVVNNEF